VEEERILGFVLAEVDQRSMGHVLTLDVLPEVRKRGIGTLLMNVLHKEMGRRKIKTVFLEVAVDNIAARRLYERLHYRYVGRIPGYYRGVQDAYCMVCFLSPGTGSQFPMDPSNTGPSG